MYRELARRLKVPEREAHIGAMSTIGQVQAALVILGKIYYRSKCQWIERHEKAERIHEDDVKRERLEQGHFTKKEYKRMYKNEVLPMSRFREAIAEVTRLNNDSLKSISA